MKKGDIPKKLVVIITVVLLILAMLMGCSKKPNKIIGIWSMTEVSGMSLAELAALSGMTLNDLSTSYTFNKDGTGVQSSSLGDVNCTWKKNKSNYTITTSGVSADATISGKTITISAEGIEAKYEKK